MQRKKALIVITSLCLALVIAVLPFMAACAKPSFAVASDIGETPPQGKYNSPVEDSHFIPGTDLTRKEVRAMLDVALQRKKVYCDWRDEINKLGKQNANIGKLKGVFPNMLKDLKSVMISKTFDVFIGYVLGLVGDVKDIAEVATFDQEGWVGWAQKWLDELPAALKRTVDGAHIYMAFADDYQPFGPGDDTTEFGRAVDGLLSHLDDEIVALAWLNLERYRYASDNFQQEEYLVQALEKEKACLEGDVTDGIDRIKTNAKSGVWMLGSVADDAEGAIAMFSVKQSTYDFVHGIIDVIKGLVERDIAYLKLVIKKLELPELGIYPGDVTPSATAVDSGDDVTFTIKVHHIGYGEPAKNVKVRLLNERTIGGYDYIDGWIDEIPSNGDATIDLNWSSKGREGQCDFMVYVYHPHDLYTANNSVRLDESQQSISVLVMNPVVYAVTIEDIEEEDIRDTSVVLSWSESTIKDFDRYEVYVSTTKDFEPSEATRAWVDFYLPSGAYWLYPHGCIPWRPTTTCRVFGLSPDTTYYFIIRVVDWFGDHADSLCQSVRTVPEVPFAPVILEVDDTDINRIKLKWSECDSPHFEAYEVHMGYESNFGLYDSYNTKVHEITDASTTYYTVSKDIWGDPLEQKRDYYFRIKTRPKYQMKSAVSNQVYARTKYIDLSAVISFSDTLVEGRPQENKRITITATVYNHGNRDIDWQGILVRFGTGDKQIGGDKSISPGLGAGKSEEVSVGWTAIGGEHEIWVSVDVHDLIPETYEENNEAKKTIWVNRPPTVTIIYPNGGEKWSGVQKITWSATDPDWDTLTIRCIQYCKESEKDLVTLPAVLFYDYHGKPRPINDGGYWWDTTSIGEGYYVVKIIVDDPSCPPYDPAIDVSDAEFFIKDILPPTWESTVGAQKAEVSGTSVTLYWNRATDVTNPVKYNIYYNTIGTENWDYFSTAIPLSNVPYSSEAGDYDCKFSIPGLEHCTEYYFVVRAEDSSQAANEERNKIEVRASIGGYETPGTTPDKKVTWTMDNLVNASAPVVIKVPPDTYIFNCGVTISAYDTLTINPGQTLLFVRYDSLKVLGTLTAVGTPENKITFSSGKFPKTPGDWAGIVFKDGGRGEVKYCVIEYADYGIYCSNASPVIENNIIQHNKVSGIASYRFSQPLIKDNFIRNNNKGIINERSGATITENQILGNTEEGISASGYCTISGNVISGNRFGILCGSSPTIEGNEIVDNSNSGIWVAFGSYGTTIRDNHIARNHIGIWVSEYSTATIINNTIESNDHGIECDYSSYPLIGGFTEDEGNEISSNTGNGIWCLGSYPTIQNNTIQDNCFSPLPYETVAGILCEYESTPLIKGNKITNNQLYGIYCDTDSWPNLGEEESPGLNEIFGHTTSDLFSANPNAVTAQWNDWHETDIISIGQRISGTVTFVPAWIPSLLPDLAITYEDISFSPETPTEGGSVAITAKIHNQGHRDVHDAPVVVQFFDGDPDNGGVQIGVDAELSSIPVGETKTRMIHWDELKGRAGLHKIYVRLDPYGAIKESDIINNKAYGELVILADTTPPGNVTALWATTGEDSVNLSWKNPDDLDFAGTMVRYREDTYPQDPTDGFLLITDTTPAGQIGTYSHSGLTVGITYYYALFTFDGMPNYSSPSYIRATIGPLGNITGMLAIPGDKQISLGWVNPVHADYVGTKVIRKIGSYPTSVFDGVPVYDVTGVDYTDTGLINGVTYYYTAFAYDWRLNYSFAVPAAQASATPVSSDITGDGVVDYKDLAVLVAAYGSKQGEPAYTPLVDLNGDGVINYRDLGILGADYGRASGG